MMISRDKGKRIEGWVKNKNLHRDGTRWKIFFGKFFFRNQRYIKMEKTQQFFF